jgi:hypothetical protein
MRFACERQSSRLTKNEEACRFLVEIPVCCRRQPGTFH